MGENSYYLSLTIPHQPHFYSPPPAWPPVILRPPDSPFFSVPLQAMEFKTSLEIRKVAMTLTGATDRWWPDSVPRRCCHFSPTGYLLLGLIAMLVVLETFCELHELKKFRKMFYVKKDKDEDQVHIIEHDQLSFSSITDPAAGTKEEQKQNEPFVAPSAPALTDGATSQ